MIKTAYRKGDKNILSIRALLCKTKTAQSKDEGSLQALKKNFSVFIFVLTVSFWLFNAVIELYSKYPSVLSLLSYTASVPSKSASFNIKTDKPDLSVLAITQCAASLSYYKPETQKKEEEEPLPETKAPETAPLPENVTETEITKGKQALFGIEINNETSYDLSDIPAYTPPTPSDGPLVLILHTHTSEAYRPSEGFSYTPSDNDRTEDTDFNVARVGEEMCSELNRLGIFAIHDETLCDYPSYNGSYKKMLSVAESVMKKYPSVKVVIDLHRDAMITADGTKISTVTSIAGEKAAQIMLVVGTDANGLYHPSWRNNLSFAVRLQQKLCEEYPSLARPLNLRCERFNGHICPYEILIEVGTNGNTLPEALISARATANALAKVITDN